MVAGTLLRLAWVGVLIEHPVLPYVPEEVPCVHRPTLEAVCALSSEALW